MSKNYMEKKAKIQIVQKVFHQYYFNTNRLPRIKFRLRA